MTATLINPHGSLEEVYSQRNVRATAGITVQTPTKLKDEHSQGKDSMTYEHDVTELTISTLQTVHSVFGITYLCGKKDTSNSISDSSKGVILTS